MIKSGIYIHIPFCKAKCNYCDFKSFSLSDTEDQYIEALLREIKTCEVLEDIEIQTIFIGGGTPTVLPPKFVEKILEGLTKHSMSKTVEITVEANPGTIDINYLEILKKVGVNRLSIGLQAWQPKHLKKLGRIHTREEFLQNYQDAMKVGFNNINIDLMFSLPEHQEEEWNETLENIISLSPKHISTYALIIEPTTPFGRLYDEGGLQLISEEADRKMYYSARDILKQHGYIQYEISNFAKKGFESKHNIIYWTRENYLGFGLGAHSFFDGCRYSNTEDYREYLNFDLHREFNKLTKQEAMSEFVWLGLRMTEGINVKKFYKQFGENIFEIYDWQIKKYIGLELLNYSGSIISLTNKGVDVSNIIFADFL